MSNTFNNWNCYQHNVFYSLLNDLLIKVEALHHLPTSDFFANDSVKFLQFIYQSITTEIPNDPDAPRFRAGKNVLGEQTTSWRRIKYRRRYRLFFKFFSSNKSIFYCWFNDRNTLRKAGASTDCYEVFKKLLSSCVGSTFGELNKSSTLNWSIPDEFKKDGNEKNNPS